MQYLRDLFPTLPKPLEQALSDTSACGSPPTACQCISPVFNLFSEDVAISRRADINNKTGVCFLISETDDRTIGTDRL